MSERVVCNRNGFLRLTRGLTPEVERLPDRPGLRLLWQTRVGIHQRPPIRRARSISRVLKSPTGGSLSASRFKLAQEQFGLMLGLNPLVNAVGADRNLKFGRTATPQSDDLHTF